MKALFAGLTALSLGGIAVAVSAATPPEPTAAESTADTFAVDAGHSSVVFRTKHLGIAEFYGRFNAVDGEVVYDAEKAENCSVLIKIPVDSLDSNNEQRDGHLKSPDFFSAKEFPTLIFESTAVELDGDDMRVTGMLTARDVTKEISATVKKIGEGEAMGAYRAGFSAHFTLDMREFGFQFVEQRPGAVGPEVDVWVALELTKQ